MNRFSTTSFGCKVNQYEQQQIDCFLRNSGLEQVGFGESADLMVIHTCCVTHVASSKSRQGIKKALKANKNAHIIVSGCLPSAPENEISNIRNLTPNITIVSRQKNLRQVLENLIFKRTNKTVNACKINNNMSGMHNFEPIKQFTNQSRAFIKVQDGCDGYCTYCIIPSIRKNVCSRSKKSIIEEAQSLVEASHSEIVLTGIFLGAYGQPTVRRKKWQGNNTALCELIDELAQVDGLKRLRLSSLEPGDVTDELLDVIEKHDNIARHFHLPLQSGSAAILKKMARQYNVSDYKDVVYKINQRFDIPALTTDIIVGFPGETDEDFAQTIEISEFAKFSKIHVFSFSPRKGTPAAQFKPKVPSAVIKERAKELSQLSDELAEIYRRQFVGERLDVVIEDVKRGTGRCGQYFEIKVVGLPGNTSKSQMVSAVLNKDTLTAQYYR